jgi:hypothetical protein
MLLVNTLGKFNQVKIVSEKGYKIYLQDNTPFAVHISNHCKTYIHPHYYNKKSNKEDYNGHDLFDVIRELITPYERVNISKFLQYEESACKELDYIIESNNPNNYNMKY